MADPHTDDAPATGTSTEKSTPRVQIFALGLGPDPASGGVARRVRSAMPWISRRTFGVTSLGLVVAGGLASARGGLTGTASAAPKPGAPSKALGLFEVRSISGAGNNKAHPDWGAAHTPYPRVAKAAYLDGRSKPPTGPNPRYVSNRIFQDLDVGIYSPRNISMWAPTWGQFLDHTFALRLGRRQTGEEGEQADIPTDNSDPLEKFRNDMGDVLMNRSIGADGTGETNPREQINQSSSYIDASAVYGAEEARLNWLREGPADGDMSKCGPRLLMRDGYLPRRDARGNPDKAPVMVSGSLPNAGDAATAGDHRANENPMLLATQTLFAREHNRIVSLLPSRLSDEDRFQIARAVVIAEQQYITYNEYLPSLGVSLPRYTGYKPWVNTGVTNEFATVGYRAHAMIKGHLEVVTEARRYSKETVDWLKGLRVEVSRQGERIRLRIPMGFTTFFQPDLVERVELAPILYGVGLRPMSKNDEMIVNQIRSLIAPMSQTLQAVNDLTSVDIARARDHGLPSYNKMRQAHGLPPKRSFREITGEPSEEFPADPKLTPGAEIDDPHCLDFVELYDIHGRPTTKEADNATRGVRRTPLAARLKAIYKDVDKVDPFVGMICEPHLPNSEFGELQHAIWSRQFAALRDGDRFFYKINPMLPYVRRKWGIDYRTTLGDLIARNTDIPRHELAPNVFFAKRTAGKGDHSEPFDAGAAAIAGTASAAGAAATLDRKPWYCGRAEI